MVLKKVATKLYLAKVKTKVVSSVLWDKTRKIFGKFAKTVKSAFVEFLKKVKDSFMVFLGKVRVASKDFMDELQEAYIEALSKKLDELQGKLTNIEAMTEEITERIDNLVGPDGE